MKFLCLSGTKAAETSEFDPLKKWKQHLSGWGGPQIPGSKAGAGDNVVARTLRVYLGLEGVTCVSMVIFVNVSKGSGKYIPSAGEFRELALRGVSRAACAVQQGSLGARESCARMHGSILNKWGRERQMHSCSPRFAS